MNSRIFVVVLVAGFAAVLGIVAYSGQSFFNDVSDSPSQVLPITVELEDLSIVEVTEKYAVLEIKFLVSNPNLKSVLLSLLKYQLYEDDIRIHAGEVGERGGGFIVGSSYITILSQGSTMISDEIVLRNTGNTPELWSALTEDTLNWKITGDAFFNLSSMTKGGEHEITFEFTK